MPAGMCEICAKPASLRCTGCMGAYYCSKEHQKAGWKKHKKVCRPFKVVKDDTLGRHLIATRDIKPGETILTEAPLIKGPAQVTVAVCLGCNKVLTEEKHRPCTNCGWPVCSEICEKAPCHIPECRYTVLRGERVMVRNFGITHPLYQCITVLRCLYQKQFLPEVWQKLNALESHTKERKHTPKFATERIQIAQFILRFFKLGNVFTEEDIMEVCGIVMVNAHEVPLTDPAHVAIYEATSMFEHSCRPNCCKSFTNEGGVFITAGEGIHKGEHLSICYTDPLWGTPNRRHHLHESKYFWCDCRRCRDNTEFGTYFSAMKCQNSECQGLMLPKTFIENTNNERLSDWTCNKCKKAVPYDNVQDILDKIGGDLSDMEKGSVEACKQFMETYAGYLHSNHYYMTDVKLALAQIIGEEFDGDLSTISEEDLNLKVSTCQHLVKLIRKLIPAEKRILGLLLYELHGAVAEIGRRKAAESGEPGELHSYLLEAKDLLKESLDLLKNEPQLLPEGKLYRQGRQDLKDMEAVLKTVHSTMGDTPA